MVDLLFAERVRSHLVEMVPFVEKKMFGGIGFLVEGKMAVGVSSKGGLIVRVEHEETLILIQQENVGPMTSSGRISRGWVIVDQAAFFNDAILLDWIERGVFFALRSAEEEEQRRSRRKNSQGNDGE